MENQRRKGQARVLRWARKVHRLTGIALFVFFVVVATTGLLLGWKKNTGGLLLADTRTGTATALSEWLPLDVLHAHARQTLRDSVSATVSTEVDRIDVRPDKGTVKFSFTGHYWGVQLDGATGRALYVERRRADFIEHLHDGSILDLELETGGDWIKLFYTTVMGLALLTFTITGFWLWYGPKRMRTSRRDPRPTAAP